MTCRHCGIEIADKALICYRCGQATVEPRIAPPVRLKRRRGRPGMIILLVLVALLLIFWLWSGMPQQ